MFVNPLMLAGLGGAAVPFALHMLSRARYRPVRWGAMMFLEGAGSNHLRSHRVKRWALLGVRMAAVGLLAVALAQPVIAQNAQPVESDAHVTAAILVDCSASMSYDLGGRTRMDLARGAALQILSGLRRGDDAVLLTAGSGPHHFTPLPTSDLQGVANRISDLDSGNGAANFAEALTSAMNVLDRAGGGKRELYLVCDRQACSWNQITNTFVSAWRDRVGKSSRLDRFVVVPVGGEGSANVAVDSITLATPPAVRGVPQQIGVRIRNYGEKAQVNVPVTVSMGDRKLLNTNVNLPAHGVQNVSIPVTFASTGSQVITATVHGRGLSGDDRLSAAFDVLQPIRTLLVSEEPTHRAADGRVTESAILSPSPGNPGEGFQRQTPDSYLEAALMPYRATGQDGTDALDARTITPAALAETDLSQFQAVILDNVPALAEEQVRALTRFVDGGGGLLIVAGDHVNAADYDARMYQNGAGLLPASLEVPSDEIGDAPIQVDALDHPVFRFLGGSAENATGSVLRRFGAAPATGAKVLARTASGEPLMIERSRGKGRVLLLTTGLDRQWGTLPETSFFLPFVQSTVRYLASAALDQHNVKPGDELVLTLRDRIEGRPSILLPDGSVAHPDIVRLSSGAQLRYASTEQPGGYEFRAHSAHGDITEDFVVQPEAEESDLSPLSSHRGKWLSDSLGFQWVTQPEKAMERAMVAGKTELWLGLTVALVGVLVAELALERFWFGAR